MHIYFLHKNVFTPTATLLNTWTHYIAQLKIHRPNIRGRHVRFIEKYMNSILQQRGANRMHIKTELSQEASMK